MSLTDTGSSKSVVQSTMFKQFEHMLQKALEQTSDHITDKLTKEIRELGQRTAELEVRVDEIENHTRQYTSELDNLKDENLLLQSRLEDQENGDRRSNLRIRGIPESIVDIQATMIALFQELQPGIPVERLEMDRVHRALAPRKTNGPPRDIIAKFHFFRTKEQLLSAARGNNNLNFQGHQNQLFTDLSPLTVAKKHALKPQLQVLISNQIMYSWGFPFSLRFTHLQHKYVCRSSDELQIALLRMGLVDQISSRDLPRRRSASRSPQQQQSSAGSEKPASSHQNLHKLGRYDNPISIATDSID